MKVRSVVNFTSMVGGEMQPWPVGRVAELPAGVNWLALGWVVEVPAVEIEPVEPIEESPAPVKAKRGKKASDA